MSLLNFTIKRAISTTAVCCSKKNFRKFPIPNKRGTRIFKKMQAVKPHPDIPINKRGVRDIGYLNEDGKFVTIPEMVPELIVPDLTDFQLKPYVSYQTAEIVQSEFTAEDLFNIVYAPKVEKDFLEGKLNADGSSKEPSPEEIMTPEQAEIRAKRTGSDIFSQKNDDSGHLI